MILVTGATGTVGRHLVTILRERGEQVRAVSRRGETRADFDDPATLRRAAAGAGALFLLTAPPEPSARHDHAMIAAARDAGVGRIVKLSAIGTGETFAGEPVGRWHNQAEHFVRESGAAWTVLRPSAFASNCLHWAEAIRRGEPVPNLTGDGAQGVIDPYDVAAVAAEALTGAGHDGQTYTLTGPEALSVPQQAAILAEVLGRPVTTVDVETSMTGARWARAGHNATVTGEVARLLGRPAGTFRGWAQATLDRLAGCPHPRSTRPRPGPGRSAT